MFFSCFCAFSLGTNDKNYFLHILQTKSYEDLKQYNVSAQNVESLLGKKALYFTALHCENAELLDQAQSLFIAALKAPEPFARMSMEKLAQIGTQEDRLFYAEKLYRKYKADIFARTVYAVQLYESGEYQKALEITGKSPLKNENAQNQNGLTKIRLLSLLRLKNADFIKDAQIWVRENEMSQEHKTFYHEMLQIPQLKDIKTTHSYEIEQLILLFQLRVSVYSERNYAKALTFAKKIDLPLQKYSAQMISDIGKSYIYGNADFYKNAALFEEAAKHIKEKDAQFLAFFYAGRLHERAKNFDSSLDYFEKAMKIAPDTKKYDNALWYYFDTAAKKSHNEIYDAVKKYASTWNNPAYFDDFLDNTAHTLLSAKKETEFVRVFTAIISYASAATAAKYSYITARLLEEKLVSNPYPQKKVKDVINECFNTAYSGDHTNLYYRFLAADKLSIPVEGLSKIILKRTNEKIVPDAQIEDLLLSYAEFGFAEKTYSLYAQNVQKVSLKTAEELAKKLVFLAGESETGESKLYTDSLRIASLAAANSHVPITKELLELLYPRPYLDSITEAAKKYKNPEYLLYGLIRSESFFQKNVVSHAGAIGLSQLMKPTAQEIAGKLKIKEYDLGDAHTNVTFGSYYLSNMVSRMENSPILALFAYNAGITRVRSWVKNSEPLERDLFLETLPLAETREYGRKVLAASALYGYLYYKKTPHQVVKEIMR